MFRLLSAVTLILMDSVRFDKGGDININGIEYQIKFENATFTNEKSLRKMLERA